MRFCQHANRGVDGGEYGTGQEYDEFDGEEVIFWFSGVTEAGVGVRGARRPEELGVFRCMLLLYPYCPPPPMHSLEMTLVHERG